MKKITLVAIATLTLFIAGCSQNEESEPSQEEATEQVTTESSSEKSQKEKAWELVDKAKAKSKEENQGEEQYRMATGRVSKARPLLDQFANSYKQWLDSSQMDVYYRSDGMAVVLPVASSELTKDQLPESGGGPLQNKNEVEKKDKNTAGKHKAPPVYVFDKDENRLAYEQNGTMTYDK